MDSILSEMADLVDQKYLNIKRYNDLTLEQKDILEQESIEALGGNIDSRQVIIDQVNQIDTRLRQLETVLKDDYGVAVLEDLANHDSVKVILQFKEKIKKIIGQAIDLDKENTGKLKSFRNQISAGIRNNQNSVQALKAYHQSNPAKQVIPVPIFMDHKM